VGPDVPVFKVYMASKHGNIFSAGHGDWDFSAVPWTLGKDFTAPTCAVCHMSLTVDGEGEVVAERTHRMNDRLAWRIFGLVYSHPRPRSPDTTIIRNKDGLPLPSDFAGGFADEFLIDGKEQKKRRSAMQAICLKCHDASWVNGHFARYDKTVENTNKAIRTATAIIGEIWEHGFAEGPGQGGSPFDEAVEKKWNDSWLFYANSIRFASAMAGGGDYGVFADGYYALSRNVQELSDWLDLRQTIASGEKENSKGKEKR
jgi:hypothetical protein